MYIQHTDSTFLPLVLDMLFKGPVKAFKEISAARVEYSLLHTRVSSGIPYNGIPAELY